MSKDLLLLMMGFVAEESRREEGAAAAVVVVGLFGTLLAPLSAREAADLTVFEALGVGILDIGLVADGLRVDLLFKLEVKRAVLTFVVFSFPTDPSLVFVAIDAIPVC